MKKTLVSEVDRGQNRLLRWIAAYGHTSFDDTVGVLTGKRIGWLAE